MAEEYFEKFRSPAKANDAEAFVYLQKAADLWHPEAVKSLVSLCRSGFCRECFGKSALKAAAKEWKDAERGIAYGLEAKKRGIDAARKTEQISSPGSTKWPIRDMPRRSTDAV